VTGAAVTTTTYSTFTTGAGTQTTAPTVVAVTPPNGSSGVPVNATVQVQLSAPVRVGSNAITLTAGGTPVTGAVSASGSVVTFTPASLLAVSTAYTITVGGFTCSAQRGMGEVHRATTVRENGTVRRSRTWDLLPHHFNHLSRRRNWSAVGFGISTSL